MIVTPRYPRGVWWLSPAGAVGLVVPVTLLMAAVFDDTHFRSSWQTPKALTTSTVGLFAVGVVIFTVGSLWPMLLRPGPIAPDPWPGLTQEQGQRLRRAAGVVFWLTMVGYAAMAAAGVVRGARPADLLRAFTEQDTFGSPLRGFFAPVTGVTTLTQLGIAYAVLAVLMLRQGKDVKVARRLALIMALALGRTFFLSERLATLELAVPTLALASFIALGTRRRTLARIVHAAPLLFVPAVILVFGALEYSRSWVFYANRGGGFLSFVLDRFLGYYVTAYNNGQLALTEAATRPRLPYQSIEALWTAPGVPDGLYQQLTGRLPAENFSVVLQQYGNPEFNSSGGLAAPFVDYGTVGGLLFLLLVGSLIGLTYREFLSGTVWAVLVYPVLVTGLFEIPRYLYWGQGRVLPAFVALLATYWWMSRPSPLPRGPAVSPVRTIAS